MANSCNGFGDNALLTCLNESRKLTAFEFQFLACWGVGGSGYASLKAFWRFIEFWVWGIVGFRV